MRAALLSMALVMLLLLNLTSMAATAAPELRSQSFDRDPGWEGVNHRSQIPTRATRQDFGYSATNHAGGGKGEMGGYTTPAGEPAWYAKPTEPLSFEKPFTASGKFAPTGRQFHVLLGFFNAKTVKEWRVRNSVALRLYGRGESFYAYLEYATDQWRAGGDSPQGFQVTDAATGKLEMFPFPAQGKPYTWELRYDPAANEGKGALFARIGDKHAICNLTDGHKQDGATFDRFGLMSIPKHYDDGGEVFFDDIAINGRQETFDRDPRWEEHGNRRTYEATDVRPRFDFGYETTHLAGGAKAGELGGFVFRGDCRTAEKMAWYGDRLETLSPAKPLQASGKLALHRGISDSTTLLGFYNSKTSTVIEDKQDNGFPNDFTGIAIEGPSSEGFYCYPVWRFGGEYHYGPFETTKNRILPDGRSHTWDLQYQPATADQKGKMTLRFDTAVVELPIDRLAPAGATVDRFGIITTRIDGNGQKIYFDDLQYTAKQ